MGGDDAAIRSRVSTLGLGEWCERPRVQYGRRCESDGNPGRDGDARRPRAAGCGPVDGLAAPRARLAGTADGVRETGLAAPADVGYDILACGQESGGWRHWRGRGGPVGGDRVEVCRLWSRR